MLEITRYARKPFTIEAVRVTSSNLQDVAKWCESDVRIDEKGKNHVFVRVHRPINDRQSKAYVGDWVLKAGTGFKVYTNKAFHNSFEKDATQTVEPQGDGIVVTPNASISVADPSQVLQQKTA